MKILVARIIMGTLGLSAWFNAVIYLPLSVATVLAQTMAIFITVMAPFILGERVGAHRIGAVLIGFAGVVLLINPFSEIASSPLWSIGLAFGLAAPFSVRLCLYFAEARPNRSAHINNSVVQYDWRHFIFCSCCCRWNAHASKSSGENFIWFTLIFIGVASSAQQFLMAKSHQLASATVLAPVHLYCCANLDLIGILFLMR